MKLTLIGTGASEGYPGFWCTCPYCSKARLLGGKNIRGNCCAMIDDDVMIDINSYFFWMMPRMLIDPGKIRTLIITHPHYDHFDPFFFNQRYLPLDLSPEPGCIYPDRISPNFSPLPLLHVYGNQFIEKRLTENEWHLMDRQKELSFQFHLIKEGKSEQAENLVLIPIQSIHTKTDGETHNYILQRNGKTVLYACDTGGYDSDMLDLVFRYTYDCVVMEGTFGLGAEERGHMCLKKNIAFRDALLSHHCLKPGSGVYLTHICPHWAPPHDEYAVIVEAEGMSLGYDGEIINV